MEVLLNEGIKEEEQIELERQQERRDLQELLDNMPDQRICYESQQSLYVQSAIHRKAMSQAAERAALIAVERYKRQNPEAIDLQCRTTSTVTLLPAHVKIDLKAFFNAVLDCVMWRSEELTTQKSILKDITERTPKYPPNANIWTRPLPKWQIKNLLERIECNRPEWKVSLVGCNTLGECRKAMLLAKDGLTKQKSFKGKVVFTTKRVLVNKASYPISHTVSKGITTARIRVTVGKKRAWITVDSLLAFLSDTK